MYAKKAAALKPSPVEYPYRDSSNQINIDCNMLLDFCFRGKKKTMIIQAHECPMLIIFSGWKDSRC